MKKGLRHVIEDHSDLVRRSNADLMKKGLRLRRPLSVGGAGQEFKRGPDEEGIETDLVGMEQAAALVQTRT